MITIPREPAAWGRMLIAFACLGVSVFLLMDEDPARIDEGVLLIAMGACIAFSSQLSVPKCPFLDNGFAVSVSLYRFLVQVRRYRYQLF